MHGYDIIDHSALNPELGTPEDYAHFVAELHRHGMGQVLDIVPNHMGVMGSDNAWWLDVLENGEASQYAEFFDIDWNPVKDELRGKVLIPILADQYGIELEKAQFKLTFDSGHGEFSIFYQKHRFPIDPKEYPRILALQTGRLQEKPGSMNDDFLELQSISTAFGHLPGRQGLTAEQRAERNREKEVQKRRLAALSERSPQIKDFLAENVATFNGNAADPRSFDHLHDLIKSQVFRLAQWRVAADDINYRRFFDINDLAALCMENETVFTSTHRFVVQLVAEGKVDGLRIDHPDGLYDPAGYCRRLREYLSETDSHRRTWVIVEKILIGNEQLNKDWPVDGTTGYEFANLVNGLFVDRTAADKMERIYRAFTADSDSERAPQFSDLVYTCKKLILKTALASELNVLANLLSRIALADRHTCDFTLNSLRSALSEIIASFPVYRTYVNGPKVSDEDRRRVEQAVAAGRKRSHAADLSVFDFIRRMLLVEVSGSDAGWYRRSVLRFAMKFQQVTAAVMAKGLEDTAFYRYNRLVSLNEVGGNPGKFGTAVYEFHRANQERSDSWPHSMLSSSTHDSKRSEDVRARINVLSEMPAFWRMRLRRWRQWNRSKKRVIDDRPAPTRNDEYLLYQTLIGLWPDHSLDDTGWKEFAGRIEQYMLKAVREAKEHTSWANTNEEYEGALLHFTRTILARTARNQFLSDFSEFHRRIAQIAMFNSLSQCLLKMTAPGVPDIYQGNELYELRLVDPDNRQPVDYKRRQTELAHLQQEVYSSSWPEFTGRVASDSECGKAKLYLTWKTLDLRRKESSLFRDGCYIPSDARGQRAAHIVAFAREYQGRTVIVVVPRLCAGLLGENLDSICDEALWGDTTIEIPPSPGNCYHNLFTGECILPSKIEEKFVLSVSQLLRHFPVAVLIREPGPCQ